MSFNEANTVEQMVLDSCVSNGWTYAAGPSLSRQASDVFVESSLRQALIKLNPEIAEQPDRADEVIYKLRAILLSVQNDGLVRSNEALAEWIKGDKTMPFGPNGEHTTVRLVDFENPANNELIACNQWTYKVGQLEKRFDVVLLVNGLPIIIGEAKTPVRPAVTWVDGASQVHDDYEESVPAMFVPNFFSFATEGKAFRYGSVRMPLDIWGPWRDADNQQEGSLADVRKSVASILRPQVVLDILQNFMIFATDKKHRRIKIICRYQQYEGTNLIVKRVVEGQIKKGLIWHFQGSGKSLLMVFTAPETTDARGAW